MLDALEIGTANSFGFPTPLNWPSLERRQYSPQLERTPAAVQTALRLPDPGRHLDALRKVAQPTSPRNPGRTTSIEEIIGFSLDVWGDADRSVRFLTTPHPSIGGEQPILVAQTEEGLLRVKTLLAAILHGLPA